MKSFRMLQASGTQIVDPAGKPVLLKGCNFGNWLLLEMWMLEINDVRDEHEFQDILTRRFGEAEKDRLMEAYRESWIGERDFEMARRFGFNVIRLPFNYRLLEDDRKPLELKPDAFKWLDAAVAMAQKHGLYVILDLHGVQGGQSEDHTTGRAKQNRLWSDEQSRRRAVWLWGRIAEHFKDSAVVAAYDLINEPYGAVTDAQRETLAGLVDEMHREIRATGDRHILFAPATLAGFQFYGSPAERGWENVGFTKHFYPGLFGQDPTPESHSLFISRTLPPVEAQLKRVRAPFLVGEFNVVFQRVGGAALMRHYFDLYASKGWASTMWAYKLLRRKGGLGPDTWAMVVNKDPLPPFNIRVSTAAETESYFRWLGTMEYDVYENLGAALAMAEPPPVFALPQIQTQLHEPPAEHDPAPWQANDINESLRGGQWVYSPASMDIYGGGADIWDANDQFRFLSQRVQSDFTLQATIKSLADSHVYAKAGLMLRRSLDSSSAHLLLHVFPNGEVSIGWRAENGKLTEQKSLGSAPFPIALRLRRKGDSLEIGFTPPGQKEHVTRMRVPDALRGEASVGFAVLSHDNRCLTTASFEDIRLTR